MDLNAIKKRLNEFQKQAQNSSGGQQKQLFWKPSIGKQVVRVVPNKFNKKFPFTEMKFYYGIGSKRVMASPSNWGEKDPIMEFAKQLEGEKARMSISVKIDKDIIKAISLLDDPFVYKETFITQ